MESDFYSVAIPEPTTILGVRLRPLSVGHLLILHRLKSSFVTTGEEFTPHDLALSVLVCSMTYKEALRFINKSHRLLFKFWHWKLARPSILQKLGLRPPTPIDIPQKSAEFVRYLSAHSTTPYYQFDANSAKPVHCPQVQIVRVSVMQAFGLSDDEIMDRSWALCIWDHITLKALAGHVTLTDRDETMEALERANRLFAKYNGGLNGAA